MRIRKRKKKKKAETLPPCDLTCSLGRHVAKRGKRGKGDQRKKKGKGKDKDTYSGRILFHILSTSPLSTKGREGEGSGRERNGKRKKKGDTRRYFMLSRKQKKKIEGMGIEEKAEGRSVPRSLHPDLRGRKGGGSAARAFFRDNLVRKGGIRKGKGERKSF